MSEKSPSPLSASTQRVKKARMSEEEQFECYLRITILMKGGTPREVAYKQCNTSEASYYNWRKVFSGAIGTPSSSLDPNKGMQMLVHSRKVAQALERVLSSGVEKQANKCIVEVMPIETFQRHSTDPTTMRLGVRFSIRSILNNNMRSRNFTLPQRAAIMIGHDTEILANEYTTAKNPFAVPVPPSTRREWNIDDQTTSLYKQVRGLCAVLFTQSKVSGDRQRKETLATQEADQDQQPEREHTFAVEKPANLTWNSFTRFMYKNQLRPEEEPLSPPLSPHQKRLIVMQGRQMESENAAGGERPPIDLTTFLEQHGIPLSVYREWEQRFTEPKPKRGQSLFNMYKEAGIPFPFWDAKYAKRRRNPKKHH